MQGTALGYLLKSSAVVANTCNDLIVNTANALTISVRYADYPDEYNQAITSISMSRL